MGRIHGLSQPFDRPYKSPLSTERSPSQSYFWDRLGGLGLTQTQVLWRISLRLRRRIERQISFEEVDELASRAARTAIVAGRPLQGTEF